MFLQNLHIINYRNISQADIDMSAGINCFIGQNGAGKTNLLDAIYYLSLCKSSFSVIDSQNIRHDEPFFVIQGEYDIDGTAETIYCGVKRGQKKQFKRNKKDYQRLTDHIGLIPLVIIAPSDEQLIADSAEMRRRYADSVISQCDREYLDVLMRYNKLVMQRNALLKQMQDEPNPNVSLLDVYDVQLAQLGTTISKRRDQFVQWIAPVLEELYQTISSGNETVTLKYVSGLQRYDLYTGLVESRQRDLARGYTSRGRHKDEIEFSLGEYQLRRVGSQGQRKSFVIALKLAQYQYLINFNGRKPLLLLDDVFDKLDAQRGENLINLVAQKDYNQIFISDTNETRLRSVLEKVNKEYRIFYVDNGKISDNQ